MHCQSQCPNSSRLNLAKVGGLHRASSWGNRRVPLLLQVLALWEGNSLSPTLLARGGQHQPQRLQRGTLETCDVQGTSVDPHLSWPTPGSAKIGSADPLGPLVSQVSWRFVRCVKPADVTYAYTNWGSIRDRLRMFSNWVGAWDCGVSW